MNLNFEMKTLSIRKRIASLFLLLLSICVHGNVTLPVLVSDGMILQRDTKINLWGWGSPGKKVPIIRK